MPIVAVELLVIGLVLIVLVPVLARMTWLIAHREEGASITEAQARENAAPLTTAILPLNSRTHGTSLGPDSGSFVVGTSGAADNGGFQDAVPGVRKLSVFDRPRRLRTFGS